MDKKKKNQTVSTRGPYPFLKLAPLFECWRNYKHRTSLLLHWFIWLSPRSCSSSPVASTRPLCLPHVPRMQCAVFQFLWAEGVRCPEYWASAYRLRCLGLWSGKGTDTQYSHSRSAYDPRLCVFHMVQGKIMIIFGTRSEVENPWNWILFSRWVEIKL
jgi:hypothetical protein